MKLGGLQKLTLIDYPGKVACTVFSMGCNFKCPFCYSSELVIKEKMRQQTALKEKDFFQFLNKRKGMLQAVVLCGGEMTLQKDLLKFAKKIKDMGYLIKLDTNGSSPQVLKSLIHKRLLDYVALDVKAPLRQEKYDEAAGRAVDLRDIKKSIDLVKKSGIDYEFRTTVVPTIHSKQDILDIADALAPAKKYYLQNFRAEKNINHKFQNFKPYPLEFLEDIRKSVPSHSFEEFGIR